MAVFFFSLKLSARGEVRSKADFITIHLLFAPQNDIDCALTSNDLSLLGSPSSTYN